jgi:hypothetical protein
MFALNASTTLGRCKHWLIAATALIGLHTQAGQASGNFTVMVQPVGVCISTSLSQQTNATVLVTCRGEQFVSIEPRPGSLFVGVHGGAWRFHMPGNASAIPAFLLASGELQSDIGMGTVTAMRVLDLQQRDQTLELLVSF